MKRILVICDSSFWKIAVEILMEEMKGCGGGIKKIRFDEVAHTVEHGGIFDVAALDFHGLTCDVAYDVSVALKSKSPSVIKVIAIIDNRDDKQKQMAQELKKMLLVDDVFVKSRISGLFKITTAA